MHKGTKVGEKNGGKMMHGVMKVKGINIGETKTGKILCEINPEAQRKRQNVADRSLNPKVYNAKYFRHNCITIRIRNWESLELHMCTLQLDFAIK